MRGSGATSRAGRCAFAGCLAIGAAAAGLAAPPRFEITFDAEICTQPYTGRVFVATSTDPRRTPLQAADWFDPEPFFAQDVSDWQPGRPLSFAPPADLGYPAPLEELPAGEYRVQAVMVLNTWSHDPIGAPGNGVSEVVTVQHDPDDPQTVRLVISQKRPTPVLSERPDLKYIKLRSDRLSAFHKRDVILQAAAFLPDAYADESHRRFPTVYVIPGFGGTIDDAGAYGLMASGLIKSVGLEAVMIYLDADCPTGHHVFADSANNGPCGAALVEELIPHLERELRLIRDADARYVTGSSSGGWSSLWLQVTYPDTFGGVWCFSPDPVDFRAFICGDAYDPNTNLLYDEQGNPRAVSRAGLFGPPIVLRDFVRLEHVVGRGGQFYSFDAVFGPRGLDGHPRFAWDRQTGRLDPEVVEHWKQYDICRLVEQNWNTLGPALQGKLYLYCGDQDEFYLDRAFVKLQAALRSLGSDAHTELIPGGRHMLPPHVMIRAFGQMKAHFDARAASLPG